MLFCFCWGALVLGLMVVADVETIGFGAVTPPPAALDVDYP